MSCADPDCLFCASIRAAYREAYDMAPNNPLMARTRDKHPAPFVPRYRGVHWRSSAEHWIAIVQTARQQILLGHFPPDEAGHEAAGLAYARYFDPEATAPLPRQRKT